MDVLEQVDAADSDPALYPLFAAGWERVSRQSRVEHPLADGASSAR